MGSRAVHNNYKDTVRSFKVPGMECSSNFASRLYVLRKIVSRYRYQASENKKTLVVSIRNHPPPTHNSRGEPQWNVSKTKRILDNNIEAGEHLKINTKELHETRDEYKLFKPTTFQFHIENSIRTTKYNHTLRVKSYSK